MTSVQLRALRAEPLRCKEEEEITAFAQLRCLQTLQQQQCLQDVQSLHASDASEVSESHSRPFSVLARADGLGRLLESQGLCSKGTIPLCRGFCAAAKHLAGPGAKSLHRTRREDNICCSEVHVAGVTLC